ncbi:hypothetical protein SNOG_16051 [Parastagonospora nodorum SN15]|uniref:Uncharacterized protein n=1 Tax=Phaeosphaeria nodorum (strain SN15 / ATCC MYA-4574 / FGSC 10173) TaxID=321614 RepID=Q0TWW9_PHANO|nr:hypothetical protein SNOG_16051 [Parastagonospora nodorum SN15]EAT76630.1 hypothetical protein SNOG_16051 [Parastagonospora nodorum SN15]
MSYYMGNFFYKGPQSFSMLETVKVFAIPETSEQAHSTANSSAIVCCSFPAYADVSTTTVTTQVALMTSTQLQYKTQTITATSTAPGSTQTITTTSVASAAPQEATTQISTTYITTTSLAPATTQTTTRILKQTNDYDEKSSHCDTAENQHADGHTQPPTHYDSDKSMHDNSNRGIYEDCHFKRNNDEDLNI